MSHAAAAFILQKSNEVLSMIKAFKRKANNNASNTATTTQNDASNSSMPQSKRTSAVNCMNLHINDSHVLFYDNNSDDSNCNIYTEIDLRGVLPTTNNLVTEPNPTSSNDSISSDMLRFLFNDSNDLQFTNDNNQSEINQIDCYVNESITSQAIVQMEMNVINDHVVTEQNLYEIDSGGAENVASKMTSCQQSICFDELAGSATNSDTSVKSNTFFANVSKSLKHKLKNMVNEEIVLKESISDTVANVARGNEPVKCEIDKASLKKRFKFKLKTGLHLFKDAKVRVVKTYTC